MAHPVREPGAVDDFQAHDEQLRGWKEIARFLRTSERTAQRWERTLDLPVHRVGTAKSGTVFANRTELIEWLKSSEGRRARNADSDAIAAQPAGADAEGTDADCDEKLAGGDRAAVSRWRPTRSAAGYALIALAAIVLLGIPLSRRASTRTPQPAGAPVVARARRPNYLKFRLVMSDNTVGMVGLVPGVSAVVSYGNGSPVAFAARQDGDSVVLDVFKVDGARTPAQRLTKSTSITLRPGNKTAVTALPGVAAIEWLPRREAATVPPNAP